MNICFVLPRYSIDPNGGYKIVYEYANRLADENNKVSIIYLNYNTLKSYPLPRIIKRVISYFISIIKPCWFKLNDNIVNIPIISKNDFKKLTYFDVVFATSVETAETVKNYFLNAKKFYLIQDYENWNVTDEYLINTYKYGFHNIVVSNWLKNIVDKYSGEESYLLCNPIDNNKYKCMIPQKLRKPHTVGLLYHTNPIKGFNDAYKALSKLKNKYLDLEVYIFGTFSKPDYFQSWIHYIKNASIDETIDIYNKVQVFMCATIKEGFGLTGFEAMSCGACLVSTSYDSILDYAKNGYNALLSPVGDVDGLVKNVSYLLDSEDERIRISNNGINSSNTYSWDENMKKLNDLLK